MKEWKARTLRMAKPRKLCRAKLVLDMLVPPLVGSLTVAGQAIISRAREAYAMLRHADNEPIGAGFRRQFPRKSDLRSDPNVVAARFHSVLIPRPRAHRLRSS